MAKKSNMPFSEVQRIFRDKKLLYAFWRAESNDDSPYHNWHLILEKMFGHFIVFDTSREYFRYGKDETNREFLEIVKKEQPDYIFFSIVYDEFDFATIQIARKLSPKSKLITLCSDDDWRFEEFSRYYAPLFDYSILMHDVRKEYKKDKIKNVIFWYWAFNCDVLRPLNIKKKYDVTFVGRPRDKHRVNFLKYLIDKGVDVHIWGDGWAKYPELAKNYHGFLNADGLVRVFNESRINLCFSMGGYGAPQVKGRHWEISACNAFVLTEYCEGYTKFFKKKEMAMFNFNDREDMLSKIKYYLSHRKESEEIAERAYKKTIIFHNQTKRVIDFFLRTLNEKPNPFLNELPTSKNSFLAISTEEIKNPEILKKKAENADYIYFVEKNCRPYKYRENIQAYSLEKTRKGISYCDYYINHPILGNYLLFKASRAFNELSANSFEQITSIFQLMFTKEYFLRNFSKISSFISGKKTNMFKKEDIAFVSMPLIERHISPPDISYSALSSSFQMKFIDKLYSLYFQKKILFSSYTYILLLKSLLRERFILRTIYDNLIDKGKIMKVKRGL